MCAEGCNVSKEPFMLALYQDGLPCIDAKSAHRSGISWMCMLMRLGF